MTLTAALAVSLSLAAATASGAGAAVLTVDDDRVECPSADFTSLVDAVAFAAQGDTIRICDGTYEVSGPSGLKIEKNLSLVGAGADKVTIQPDGSVPSLATATPNERDEFGNVITVKRRLVELANVSISGLTVRANGVAVEGGIALIDVNESHVENVRVTGLVPAGGPGTGDYGAVLASHGHGVILANTIADTVNAATVRGLAVDGFNKAGVVVDSRGLSGTGQMPNTMTADLSGVTVTGAGTSPTVAQNGIEVWGSGATLTLAGSAISGVAGPSATPGTAAALYFRGASAGSLIGGSAATANSIAGNTFGAWAGSFDGTTVATPSIDARTNYWGSSNGPSLPPTRSAGDFVGAGAPSFGAGVQYAPFAGTAPRPVTAPLPVADAAPTARFDTLTDGAVVALGDTISLDVVAADDFGVREVAFLVDGETVATRSSFPYVHAWTPSVGDGRIYAVSAVVTDSAGQTTTITANVRVGDEPVVPPVDPPYVPPVDPPTDLPGPPVVIVPPVIDAPVVPTEVAACPRVSVRVTRPVARPRNPSRKSLRGQRIERGVTVGVRPSSDATVTATARVRYRYQGRMRTMSLRSARASVAGDARRNLVLTTPSRSQAQLPVGRSVRVTLTVTTRATDCSGPTTRRTTATFNTRIARVGVAR